MQKKINEEEDEEEADGEEKNGKDLRVVVQLSSQTLETDNNKESQQVSQKSSLQP